MEEGNGKEPRALVADDDESIRELVCTIVKREQIAVDCVADGAARNPKG